VPSLEISHLTCVFCCCKAESLRESLSQNYGGGAAMKPNCAVLVLSAVLFALCLGQEEQKEQVITSEDKSAENRWPKTSVWLVSFDGREGTRLIVEAADLLASQDFGCTLVLVGPAANNPIKPSNKLIKVSKLIAFFQFSPHLL